MIRTETAVLGNGCFWCTEAIFQLLDGVISVKSGYSGGHTENPDYKSVCTGETGHAECLEIKYDPARISYQALLQVFFDTHDPTTLNRQGNDVGTQYRSVIFLMNNDQEQQARSYIKELNDKSYFPRPVVTTLENFTRFFPAENYHQNYYLENGTAPYCQFVVRPKVDKFKNKNPDKLKKMR